MNICVETATKAKEYDWYSESGGSCSYRPRSFIPASSASFAFQAERTESIWAVTMHNLYLPDRQDMNNRRIRLSIRFDRLESEAQVRALALAYLALPLKTISSTKSARYCAELADCCAVSAAGTPLLQFDKIKQWAEAAINNASLTTPGIPSKSTCFAEIDKSRLTEVGELQSILETYALRDKDGLRLLFDDGYVEGMESDVDVIVTTCDTGSRIQHTPFIQAAAEKAETESGLSLAKKFAMERLEDTKTGICNAVKENEFVKKLLAGGVIVLILTGMIYWINQATKTPIDTPDASCNPKPKPPTTPPPSEPITGSRSAPPGGTSVTDGTPTGGGKGTSQGQGVSENPGAGSASSQKEHSMP